MVDLLCSYGASRSVDLLAHYGDLKTAAAVFAANAALADDPGALSSAAGNEGFVRLMLRYQPELPKRIAVGAKTRELNELLFQHGMNPSQADWNLPVDPPWFRPLAWANRRGHSEIGRLLERHGAKGDTSQSEGSAGR